MEIISKSEEETRNLAKKLGERLKPGDVICLWGDLGTGKTLFIQGIAEGLGIERRITSPSFFTMRVYGNFYHLDLYHVQSLKEVKGLSLEEIFLNPENIVAIEWAEKLKNVLPKKRIDVEFKYVDDKKRRIKITKRS